jgi:D-beta-D-heptose 7-phosphate kinase/D-beta-D-heptose 1-phosphate adenosyltransferase
VKRVVSLKDMIAIRRRLKRQGRKVVFTNGVFDILHAGHAALLEKAASFGDVLVLGLNSDASVRRLKGASRPIVPFRDRAKLLASLRVVDYVVGFSQDTPLNLIRKLLPDVLVKGADYKLTEIVGADCVKASGGEVVRVRLSKGRSTSRILDSL